MTPQPSELDHGPRDRALTSAVAGSIAVVVAGSAGQLIDYAFFDLKIDFLDSTDDGGAFGVVGDVAAASAAVAAWVLLLRARSRAPVVVALPPLLTFLSIDKILRLHDHVPNYIVVYAPVLLAVFACVVILARRAPRALARILVFGLAALVVSFTLHVAGERLLLVLGLQHVEWVRQVKVALKHGCEAQGWFLVAIGLAFSALRSRRSSSMRRGPATRGQEALRG